jgi:folate-dependent phosphoribosylglycinamide formyltransferase PurN
LPAFRGLRPQARALEEGVRVSGATVHFVSEEMDAGPIIAQGVAPVLPQDTEETLSARILAMEHRLYPLALKLVAGGAAWLDNGRVAFASPDLSPTLWPQA